MCWGRNIVKVFIGRKYVFRKWLDPFCLEIALRAVIKLLVTGFLFVLIAMINSLFRGVIEGGSGI